MKNKRLFLLLFMLLTLFAVSCKELTEPLLNKEIVTLLAPVDKVVSADSVQIFYWNYLQDSAKYELQVVSPKFDSIVRLVIDTVVSSNQFPLSLKKGDYEWRVRAVNYSSSSQYSTKWSLTIQ